MVTHDHIIGGAIVAVIALFIYLIILFKGIVKQLTYEEPEPNQYWRVGDFKMYLQGLPDDMPVILLDTTTDDEGNCNYHFTNQDVAIDDFYRRDDYYMDMEPKGKGLFLYFENVLNENPIN